MYLKPLYRLCPCKSAEHKVKVEIAKRNSGDVKSGQGCSHHHFFLTPILCLIVLHLMDWAVNEVMVIVCFITTQNALVREIFAVLPEQWPVMLIGWEEGNSYY